MTLFVGYLEPADAAACREIIDSEMTAGRAAQLLALVAARGRVLWIGEELA